MDVLKNSRHLQISSKDFANIETEMFRLIKERQRFERLVVAKTDLLELFAYNKYKLRVLEKKVTGDSTTIYRCGTLIDLCLGPHIRHTGRIKALKITKVGITFEHFNSDNFIFHFYFIFSEGYRPFQGRCECRELGTILRHFISERQTFESMGEATGRSSTAQSSQNWPRSAAIFLPRNVAGLVFLPAAWRPHLQQTSRFHQIRISATWFPRGDHTKHLQYQIVENFRPLGAFQ